ncbi:hypothetical protein K437DRAFT_226098, partial [Tilletiaria anomala UBC 951]
SHGAVQVYDGFAMVGSYPLGANQWSSGSRAFRLKAMWTRRKSPLWFMHPIYAPKMLSR